MNNDNDHAIAAAIRHLRAIEEQVRNARGLNIAAGGLTTARSLDDQVRDVVQLLSATEIVRQLDKLVRAAT
jgi:hypothetical protein